MFFLDYELESSKITFEDLDRADEEYYEAEREREALEASTILKAQEEWEALSNCKDDCEGCIFRNGDCPTLRPEPKPEDLDDCIAFLEKYKYH